MVLRDRTATIIEAIAQIQPGYEDWLELDGMLNELWASGEPHVGIEVLFKVFERFPEHDGYGVFWSIVHGLESLSDYEPALIDSLRRQPTEFNVLMVERILIGGVFSVAGREGLTLLKEVLAHPKATAQAKQNAAERIEYIKASRVNLSGNDAVG